MEKNNTELTNLKIALNTGYIIRVMVFILGIFILAMGAATIITANLGVATWDVLHIGLADLTGLSVGRWVQIIGILMLLTTAFFEKKGLAIGSILNIVMVGFFLNLILDARLLPSSLEGFSRFIMLLIGIIFMGTGSGMYVSSKLGAGPRDGMTLFISKRFSISVRLARTLLEMTALTCGWIIGGPVAFGTFITVPLVGPIMQASLRFCTKKLENIKA